MDLSDFVKLDADAIVKLALFATAYLYHKMLSGRISKLETKLEGEEATERKDMRVTIDSCNRVLRRVEIKLGGEGTRGQIEPAGRSSRSDRQAMTTPVPQVYQVEEQASTPSMPLPVVQG